MKLKIIICKNEKTIIMENIILKSATFELIIMSPKGYRLSYIYEKNKNFITFQLFN